MNKEEENMRSVRLKSLNERLWTDIAQLMKVQQEEIKDWKLRPGVRTYVKARYQLASTRYTIYAQEQQIYCLNIWLG